MKFEQIEAKLRPLLPKKSSEIIARWISEYKVHVKFTRPRNSKLGDYTAPWNGHGHRISVNRDLNPYSMLVTLIHEFAHLATYIIHGRHSSPHGKEWKSEYSRLLKPFVKHKIFPEDIELALIHYIKKPAAGSCSDYVLFKALKKYDRDKKIYLEELPLNTTFRINGNRIFVKGERLRKRFKCVSLNNKAVYYVDPLAEVELLPTDIKV